MTIYRVGSDARGCTIQSKEISLLIQNTFFSWKEISQLLA